MTDEEINTVRRATLWDVLIMLTKLGDHVVPGDIKFESRAAGYRDAILDAITNLQRMP